MFHALSFCDIGSVQTGPWSEALQLRVAGWKGSHLGHRVAWDSSKQLTTVTLAGRHTGAASVMDEEGRGNEGRGEVASLCLGTRAGIYNSCVLPLPPLPTTELGVPTDSLCSWLPWPHLDFAWEPRHAVVSWANAEAV